MNRVILHIDMDAFFAAVEQLDHPEYRGKPLIVGADPKGGKGRGVVSTCSYEARKFGIHSAMPISQAYRKCPFAIYLPGRMERYQEVSHQVMDILNDFSSQIEQVSIDEAFLDISGSIRLLGSPRQIGVALKKRIREELKLTASIGIAPNKFVAKIASDLEKPDGLVIVEFEQMRDFLKPLPITKMWGVGKKTEPVLLKLGIRTIGEIADYSKEKITKLLGKSGLQFWYLANGIDDREVKPYSECKSVSQEITFDEDTDDVELIKQTLFHLSDKLSRQLRKRDLKGKTITLKIRLEDFSTYTRSQSYSDFINSAHSIYQCIENLFTHFERKGFKVRLVGVGISNLNCQWGEQISIFEEMENQNKKIDYVIDLVEEKLGANLIKKASLINRNIRTANSNDTH